MLITEEWILSHAPGPAVAKSGRALSDEGRYSARGCTADGKTCWAECTGSARNPYSVSIDWSLSDKDPVYSCSCASLHTPCRHVLGLAYELLRGKEFESTAVPGYVLKARVKQAAERGRAKAKLNRARRRDEAAKEKKLEWGLEGLAKAERLSDELISLGLTSSYELPAQSLERMAVELGNYGLPGARDMLDRAALLDRRLHQEDSDARACRAGMLRELAALRALTVRGREYFDGQRGGRAVESPLLHEQLGGTWSSEELREMGSWRRSARLVQLSFDVRLDEARRAYVERGYWLELSRGDLVQTLDVRPVKEGRFISADTCFELVEVPALYVTPMEACPRVWWISSVCRPLTTEELSSLRDLADSQLASALQTAREQLAEPLLPGVVPVYLHVGAVGRVGGELVLEGADGARIALRDRKEDGRELASTLRLRVLPKPPAVGDALFGLVFYEETERRLCLHPYALVREDGIVRLQF